MPELKHGRKFFFAIFVLIFVISSIALITVLLYIGKIGEITFKELYIFSGGFITLLAGSYFFVNTISKKYENGKK